MSPGRISNEVRARVRAQAGNRCGYCQSPQKYILGLLEIDHIIPQAQGGTDDEENLLWRRF
jgi:5-methylcytosine-specific restriction endonuclease McrA